VHYASPQFVGTGVEKSLLTPRANLREMSTGQVNRRAFLNSATNLQVLHCYG